MSEPKLSPSGGGGSRIAVLFMHNNDRKGNKMALSLVFADLQKAKGVMLYVLHVTN